MRVSVALVFAVVSLLAPGWAEDAPQPGMLLPPVVGKDVSGTPRKLPDLVRGPTLVVAITDRNAGDAMQAWFDAADAEVPGAHHVSIVSIDTPFFVSDGYARGKARQRIPRSFWPYTLFDTDHELAGQLELRVSDGAYVFAVDGQGRVLAAVHGWPQDPGAESIWRHLRQALAQQ